MFLATIRNNFSNFAKKKSSVSTLEIIILAIGLGMDSFAISIANGITMPKLKFQRALGIAAIMGIFHIIMPVIGYYFALLLEEEFKQIDHWIAFALLGFIGCKMIYEYFQKNHSSQDSNLNIKAYQLILQSIATSIDALVIGISLGFLHMNIYKSSVVIGAVTFLMVMMGLKAGIIIGNKLGKSMEFLGGIILIAIGIKILIEHIYSY